MGAAEFDLSEWEFLPPLDDADLPSCPPDEFDLSVLDETQLVDVLVAVQRQQSALAAREAEVLALINVRDSSEKHWLTEEVGAVMRVAGGVARGRLASADQLARRLPRTFAALREGGLSPAQATALTQGSFELPDEVLAEYEDRLLARAGDQSLTGLRRSIRRAVIALDPATAEQKATVARNDRHVRFVEADYGMTWLYALLPAADAKAIYARLDGAARLAPADEPCTMDQLRADALTTGILKGITGELPTEHGRQPAINVLVPLSTLVGQDDEPAWLDGYGPITAQQAREIAHDPTGTWRRIITDPVTGQLLDYGRTRYRPPQHLADHVITRDGECSFPFCSHTARRSDLDHIDPFPSGPTSATNLQPLHRRHHNAKTQAGWRQTRDPDTGDTTWTSPHRRTYRTRPPERWHWRTTYNSVAPPY